MSDLGQVSSSLHFLHERVQESKGFAFWGKDSSLLASTQAGQAFLSALALLRQNIEHLHTLVQLIALGGRVDAATTLQQLTAAAGMATVITQLVAVAAGFLPQEQPPTPQSISALPVNLLDAAAHPGFPPSLGSFLQNFAETSHELGNGLISGSKPFGFMAGHEGHSTDITCSGGGTKLNRSLEVAEQFSGANQDKRDEKNDVDCTNFSENINLGKFDFPMDNQTSLMLFNSLEEMGSVEDQEIGNGFRDDEEDGDAENLQPGSYELMELDAMEILAEHAHFCEICGKGFKRDANLRMHMRGHGDEYKTAAALAKPDKFLHDLSPQRPRRYSCPFLGCKRNKKHKKFLPLKTLLCVKNHYRRSHCPKMLTCPKCKVKNFSLVADLKTHGKHCGKEKWQCSCGTTFSRKDKLLGHVALFLGHTPATPSYETDSPGNGERSNSEIGSHAGNININCYGNHYRQGAALGFGAGIEHNLEVKPSIPAVGNLGSGGSYLTCANFQSSDPTQGAIALSEGGNSGAESGSQFNPLSMFQQTGASLVNSASDFHIVFGSSYMISKQSRDALD